MKIVCEVYKSRKKDDMYLYVNKEQGLNTLSEPLLTYFDQPIQVMTIILQPGRKMGITTSDKILDEIETQGYYLQMPATKETYMQTINAHNHKLNR